uniref:3CxxC-type domain-containing protein n=1 Tax=Meleagris gallopavo TaxID=9103 RepID=G1N6Q0_MELGA
FPTLYWTMTTWQRIFAEKAASLKLMDPWTFQEDNSLQLPADCPGLPQKAGMSWCLPCPGRFQCSQCLYKWSSAKVHILFHMCYGMVLMRIFRQACRQCHEPQLEEPIFSLENIERLLHNLVLKILEDFYNVPMQSADLLEVVVDGCHASGPHDRTHCEGCRLGVCSRSRAAMEPSSLSSFPALSFSSTSRSPGASRWSCDISVTTLGSIGAGDREHWDGAAIPKCGIPSPPSGFLQSGASRPYPTWSWCQSVNELLSRCDFSKS